MKTKTLMSGAIVTLALAATTQAQNITQSTSSTASWVGTPSQQTGAAPTTDNGGTTQDNNSWGGNLGGTGNFGTLAQSFELGSAGTLQNVQMVFAGSPATFNVELYDLGAYPAGYPSVPQQINPSGNLLQPGDSFAFGGIASGQTLVTLTFGGLDANVSLQANELYLLALDPTANADNTWWARGGVPTLGGLSGSGLGYNADGGSGSLALQNFESKTSIRDFDMAVTVTATPEPSSIALLGLGALAGVSAIRRRKA